MSTCPIHTQLRQEFDHLDADPIVKAQEEAEGEAHAAGMSYEAYMRQQEEKQLIARHGSLEAAKKAETEKSAQRNREAQAAFRMNPIAYLKSVTGWTNAQLGHRLKIGGTTVKRCIDDPERTTLGVIRKIELILLEINKVGGGKQPMVTGF